MTSKRIVVLATAAVLCAGGQGAAYGASFGAAQALDLQVTGPLAAAVGSGGEAVVAGVRGIGPGRRQVAVATRARSGGAWNNGALGPIVTEARDVQALIARGRAVVAWGEARRHRQSVVVATGRVGGALTLLRRVPVADAFAASPRLERLRSGAVVLAWRDGTFRARSRVRIATLNGDHVTASPRTVGTDAALVVLAPRAAGAAIGWISTYHVRPGTNRPRSLLPRTLTVVALDARGAPAGGHVTVGRDVGSTARLAGALDGRLVASWVRPQQVRPYPGEDRGDAPPPTAYVSPLGFTRQVFPRPRPARPVGGPINIAVGVPSVALLERDRAVMAVRATPPGMGPAYDLLAANSSAAGPWSALHQVAHLSFTRMDPVVAVPTSDDVVIVYTALTANAGTPLRWTVAASTSTGIVPLGATTASDGRGVAVASARGRVLVAWPDGGRLQIAERG